MVQSLTHKDFEPHLDRMFQFPGWPGTLRLAVIDVKQDAIRPDNSGPSFTLIFHGPRNAILPEGLYDASPHDQASAQTSMMFYIMPIHTAAADRQDYQGIFN